VFVQMYREWSMIFSGTFGFRVSTKMGSYNTHVMILEFTAL